MAEKFSEQLFNVLKIEPGKFNEDELQIISHFAEKMEIKETNGANLHDYFDPSSSLNIKKEWEVELKEVTKGKNIENSDEFTLKHGFLTFVGLCDSARRYFKEQKND